jgi:hypothetical protein
VAPAGAVGEHDDPGFAERLAVDFVIQVDAVNVREWQRGPPRLVA